MASDHTPQVQGAPHYTWKMMSSAHVKKRKKLKGIQKQLGQMFSLEAYDFPSSDSDVSTAAAGGVEPNLTASDTVARTDEMRLPSAKRRRIRTSSTSIDEKLSPHRLKVYHRLTGSALKSLGHAVEDEAERKKMHPSIRVSGSEAEGSIDYVPETSQESVSTCQPNLHVHLSGENVDNEQTETCLISEASNKAKEGIQCDPERRVRKKKHKRREQRDAVKVHKKKRKRRNKERMKEGNTHRGWEPWWKGCPAGVLD